ncbi:hypothetical protein PENTCL1PPCAC_11804, partial [Pristionchus entomophagus]
FDLCQMRLLVLAACMWAWASADSLYSVEGTVVYPRGDSSLPANTRILLNYGKYVGFPREDGTFAVNGVAPGSYIVQVENVDYVFEPVRVDITASGKMRTRKISLLQPGAVQQLPYPLKLVARESTRYFRKREEWRVTDVLFSPMVLMIALPLGIMLILPKLTANDPELQKEMENMQLPKMDMPDMSDMMANFFGPKTTGTKKITGGKTGAAQKKKN